MSSPRPPSSSLQLRREDARLAWPPSCSSARSSSVEPVRRRRRAAPPGSPPRGRTRAPARAAPAARARARNRSRGGLRAGHGSTVTPRLTPADRWRACLRRFHNKRAWGGWDRGADLGGSGWESRLRHAPLQEGLDGDLRHRRVQRARPGDRRALRPRRHRRLHQLPRQRRGGGEAAAAVEAAGGVPHLVKADVGTDEGCAEVIAAVRGQGRPARPARPRRRQSVRPGRCWRSTRPSCASRSRSTASPSSTSSARRCRCMGPGSTVFYLTSRGARFVIPDYGVARHRQGARRARRPLPRPRVRPARHPRDERLPRRRRHRRLPLDVPRHLRGTAGGGRRRQPDGPRASPSRTARRWSRCSPTRSWRWSQGQTITADGGASL